MRTFHAMLLPGTPMEPLEGIDEGNSLSPSAASLILASVVPLLKKWSYALLLICQCRKRKVQLDRAFAKSRKTEN